MVLRRQDALQSRSSAIVGEIGSCAFSFFWIFIDNLAVFRPSILSFVRWLSPHSPSPPLNVFLYLDFILFLLSVIHFSILLLLKFSRHSCVISLSILLSFIIFIRVIFLLVYSLSLSIVTRELTILQYLPHILVVCGYVNLLHHFPGFRMLHAKHFCVQALLYSALWKKNSSRLMAAVLSPLLFYCRFTLNPPGSYSPLYCLFPRASLCTLIYCYFSLSADQAPVALPGLPRASA